MPYEDGSRRRPSESDASDAEIEAFLVVEPNQPTSAHRTPLPKLQILLFLGLRSSEPLMFFVIFPYESVSSLKT